MNNDDQASTAMGKEKEENHRGKRNTHYLVVLGWEDWEGSAEAGGRAARPQKLGEDELLAPDQDELARLFGCRSASAINRMHEGAISTIESPCPGEQQSSNQRHARERGREIHRRGRARERERAREQSPAAQSSNCRHDWVLPRSFSTWRVGMLFSHMNTSGPSVRSRTAPALSSGTFTAWATNKECDKAAQETKPQRGVPPKKTPQPQRETDDCLQR